MKARQAFSLPKILEAALAELPDRDLLLAQRVCRAFQDVITKSGQLQRRLFFAPQLTDTWKPVLWRPTNTDNVPGYVRDESQPSDLRMNPFVYDLISPNRNRLNHGPLIKMRNTNLSVQDFDFSLADDGTTVSIEISFEDMARDGYGGTDDTWRELRKESSIFKMYLCQSAVPVGFRFNREGTESECVDHETGTLFHYVDQVELHMMMGEHEEDRDDYVESLGAGGHWARSQ